MTDSDLEGPIQFNVTHNDCAGNDGTPISETSDNSYVYFWSYTAFGLLQPILVLAGWGNINS